MLYSKTIGEGPDLVLLHGWGMHSGVWQHILTPLTKGYRVTLIDLPGFGQSSALPNNQFTLQPIAELISANTPKHAIWLGWSLGGLIATAIAASDEAKVRQLILVNSTPKFIQQNDWPGINADFLISFLLNANKILIRH